MTKNTRRDRARVLASFAEEQPGLLVAWNQSDADRWVRRRREHCSAATLAKDIRIVRSFLLWLGEAGIEPPLHRIKLQLPKVKSAGRARYRHITATKLAKILEEIRPSARDAVEALWWTGLRIGELVASRPEHLESPEALWVPPGKTTMGRAVPLTPPALAALERWWAGRKISPQAVGQAMALVTDASPHDLRHSRAKLWLREGVTIDNVRAWMGHSSIMMTQRYVDVRHTQEAE